MSIPANSYIVLQAYGDRGILNECAFALLSLCSKHTREELKDVEVWLYTDDPAFFKSFKGCWLNLRFREISPALVNKWRGDIDFVHRVKIEVLRHFLEGNQGQVLYLDTDIYFSESIAHIFGHISDGKLYMHVMEGQVHKSENLVLQKLSKYLRKRPVIVKEKVVAIPENIAMWNAGVLGFDTRYGHLLEEIMAFTDTVYKEFPKHVVEQFAFSLYFQTTAPLLGANKEIHHYWNVKELRLVLASFFSYFKEKRWDELVEYSSFIQPVDLMQQKISFLQNRPLTKKLGKKQWEPVVPEWELLVHQA